jgi:heme/copper-type cytochrome/quinol oxidase subunit 2
MRSHDGDMDVKTPGRTNRYRSPQSIPRRDAAAFDGRSVADLLRDLSTETVSLVRQELELARAEMRDKLEVYQKSTLALGVGAALLLGALFTGLWALNTGLTALLAQSMALEIAVWLSPLILTVVLGAIGWGMIRGAMNQMKEEGLVPRQTTTALRDDKRWVQEKAHEIKEEITHGR